VMKKPFSLNNLYKFICDPASLTHPQQLRLPVFLLSPEVRANRTIRITLYLPMPCY
jgi:hypothetical protein